MHAASDVTRFNRVDDQSDPDYFVRFVDQVNEMPQILQVEDLAVEELRLWTGARVLDLGCARGDYPRRLAALVAPSGEAVGIDASAAMITVARQRGESSGLPVSFHV